MEWLKKAQEKTLENAVLDVYPQLSADKQTALKNVITLNQRLKNLQHNPEPAEANLKIELAINALHQLNNLYSSVVSENIRNDYIFILNEIKSTIYKIIAYYEEFINEEQPIEVTEEDIVVTEPSEWVEPKEIKEKKKRRLTSMFLPEDVKRQREQEIEAFELGLSKEQYDKVSEPADKGTKLTAKIEFPNQNEVDVDDFEQAIFVLNDREDDIPEELKQSYGILKDAVGFIANAIDDQKAEIAFREFENVFAEVANGLVSYPELFEDLSEWLGIVYVAAYKIAAEFDLEPQADITDDLVVHQSGGSTASYDFRKNIKEYWKKYRQGGIFKRVYHPETKSFSFEYVGNDPEKRKKVLETSKKNYDNYMNRLTDSGKKELKQQTAKRKEKTDKTRLESSALRFLKNKRLRDKRYLNKIKALSTWPAEMRQNELAKIEQKRQTELDELQKEFLNLPEDERLKIQNKIKEIDSNLTEQKNKLLRAFNNVHGLVSLSNLFFRLNK